MKLKKLIADLPIEISRGGKDVEITGICTHSKRVAFGDLFIAKKGSCDDGANYCEQAIENGAAAFLTDLANPFLQGAVQLICSDIPAVEGKLVAKYYGYSSDKLYVVGVTGTNGKTTISYLVKHLLDRLDLPCGLIGGVSYMLGSHQIPADRTTPDLASNHKFFNEMLKSGCAAAVMEVSSHGLAQRRVDEVVFDVAIFSNLSHEHLDYHHTMERYAEQKSKLFAKLDQEKWAIVSFESPWSPTILKNCGANTLSYGFHPDADLYADEVVIEKGWTSFSVHYKGEKQRFTWNLLGRFNILNGLAALAVCLTRGVALNVLPEKLCDAASVPGRLEKIEHDGEMQIFVDYAHKPDALEQVLQTLQEMNSGRILTVVGCGGERDRSKRSEMGKIAERYSDFTFITSDNPRSEDPMLICEEIAKGFSSSHFCIEIDRRVAIERAIEAALPQDLILIAGKGHETYQVFARQTVFFDDRQVAQEIANRLVTS